jgi:hypothetical protein
MTMQIHNFLKFKIQCNLDKLIIFSKKNIYICVKRNSCKEIIIIFFWNVKK